MWNIFSKSKTQENVENISEGEEKEARELSTYFTIMWPSDVISAICGEDYDDEDVFYWSLVGPNAYSALVLGSVSPVSDCIHYGLILHHGENIYFASVEDNGYQNRFYLSYNEAEKNSNIRDEVRIRGRYSSVQGRDWKYRVFPINDIVKMEYQEEYVEINHSATNSDSLLSAKTNSVHYGVQFGSASIGSSAGAIEGRINTAGASSGLTQKIIKSGRLLISTTTDVCAIEVKFWETDRSIIRDFLQDASLWEDNTDYRQDMIEIAEEFRTNFSRLFARFENQRAEASVIEVENKFKDCPFCGEEILAKAIKCKHCQSMLDD